MKAAVGWIAGAALGALAAWAVLHRGGDPPASRTEAGPAPAAAAPVAGASAIALELESREAQLAALALANENEELRRAHDALQRRLGEVTELLAERGTDAAVERIQQERAALPPGPVRAAGGVLRAESVRVIDVNQALRMVVLDAGARKGIRNGMSFAVVRNQAPVARVRVVEVRQEIAGAEWTSGEEGAFPRKGERAVLDQADAR